MLTSDPLDILLAHDAWGTRLLLDRARPLSRDQFHRRFEIGPGSLHDTFTHMLGAMRRWSDRLAERPLRPALMFIPERPDIAHDSAERTVEQLIELHTLAAADIAAIAQNVRATSTLASTITLDWPAENGKTKRYTFTRGAVFTHVCTHGVHHRAQIINMFRHLSVPGLSDNLPELDLVDWQAQTESPAVML
jgi:uncharacterized damage-inducible protein DinB